MSEDEGTGCKVYYCCCTVSTTKVPSSLLVGNVETCDQNLGSVFLSSLS
jgi:hypothetical protein